MEANAQAGPDIKPPQPDAAKQQAQQAAAATPQVTTQFSPAMDLAGVEKSAVYKINPDNTVETVWTSKEENAYDILQLSDRLLISTDAGGRVYALSPDRKLTLVAQTNEGEATRLLDAGTGVLVATSNMGRIYRLADSAAGSGSYESPVYDAGSTARWGSLSWRGQAMGGATLKFQTRAGTLRAPTAVGATGPPRCRIPPARALGAPTRATSSGGRSSPPAAAGCRRWTASRWPTCRRTRRRW